MTVEPAATFMLATAVVLPLAGGASLASSYDPIGADEHSGGSREEARIGGRLWWEEPDADDDDDIIEAAADDEESDRFDGFPAILWTRRAIS